MKNISKNFIYFFMILLISPYAHPAKNFIYCSEGSPSAFNPQITTDGPSNNAAAHTIYDRLVEFEYGSTEIIPALASKWEISKDRLTYTFTLRDDVSFHKTKYFSPTRKMNADDVLFSINRMRQNDHPYNKVSGGAYEYFNGMEMGSIIKEVKKLNDHKVQMTLSRAEAPFLANMAMSFMSILSKEYADQLIEKENKDDIDTYPIGTGPFIFRKYKKDAIIRFKKNKEFWGTPAKIDNLIFAITPDASVRTQKLKNNECHLVIEPAINEIENLKKSKNLKLMSGAGLNVGYLAMNTAKEPLNDLRVRRAINMALNKDSYINAIYMGHAIKAKNPLPPTIWSYNKEIKPYEYNITKAKALIKEAKIKEGTTLELWTLPVTRPYNPNGKKMGEMMQADLAKIGLNIKLITYDWPTYLKKARSGEHQLIQLGWTGDNGDPDNFLNVLLGCAGVEAGSNVSRWCNQKFENHINKAKLTTNKEKRTTHYQKAQEIFNEQAPWAPIAHSKIFRAMNKKVVGYKIDPLGGDIFKDVDLK